MILYQRRCGEDGVIAQPVQACIGIFSGRDTNAPQGISHNYLKIASNFRKFLLTTELQE